MYGKIENTFSSLCLSNDEESTMWLLTEAYGIMSIIESSEYTVILLLLNGIEYNDTAREHGGKDRIVHFLRTSMTST